MQEKEAVNQSERVILWLISDMVESPFNPRRRGDPAKQAEFEASIKQDGIQQPLIVRDVSTKTGIKHSARGTMEIVCGSRRFNAAKKAGLVNVPVIVRELTDEEARQTQQIENLQREDIHPLDEAEGYAELLKFYGGDIKKLGVRLMKKETYIRQRMKLCDLGKAGRDLMLAGKLGLGAAERLARIPAAAQDEVLKSLKYRSEFTESDIDRSIRNDFFLDLHSAPWKMADAELVPSAGACTTCPKRTGYTPELFPDVAKKDTCTDAACFKAKAAAFVARKVEEFQAEGKPVERLAEGYYAKDKAPAGALNRDKFTEITNGRESCDKMTQGIYVDGGRVGRVVKVCADPKCKVHSRNGTSFGGGDDSWKKKQAAERKKAIVDRAVGGAILDAIVDKAKSFIGETRAAGRLRVIAKHLIHRMEHNDTMTFCKRKGLESIDKKQSYGGVYHDWETPVVNLVDKVPAGDLVPLMLEMALWNRATSVGGGYYRDETRKSLFDYAKSEGVDAAKIERKIRAEFAAKAKVKKTKSRKTTSKDNSRMETQVSSEPTCIGCGCQELSPCPGGCAWKKLDKKTNRGLCTDCVDKGLKWPKAVAGKKATKKPRSKKKSAAAVKAAERKAA